MPPPIASVRLDWISGWLRLAGRTLALFVMIAPAVDRARAGDVAGQASVIDGDTIEIHGTRVRLYGIDAPEHDQLCRDAHGGLYRCGQVAANALGAFIGRQTVACVEVDRDRYGRSVAVCSVGKVDLGDWLVRSGLAVDWPRYSKGDYAPAEAEARGRHSGIWSGRFVEPWRYRRCIGAGGRPNVCSVEATGGQR